jgi:hypothetical protein
MTPLKFHPISYVAVCHGCDQRGSGLMVDGQYGTVSLNCIEGDQVT